MVLWDLVGAKQNLLSDVLEILLGGCRLDPKLPCKKRRYLVRMEVLLRLSQTIPIQSEDLPYTLSMPMNSISYQTPSVLLRAIREDLGSEAVDMADVEVDENKPLIDTIGATVGEALELLSKVGLNDAFLFLRPYKQLSNGQKYRYRVAKLIESKAQWWLIDEFCALLDRDTAKIIAFNFQKLARQQGKAVIAATTPGDLFEDLAPSVNIHKRFGEEIQIDYYPNIAKAECSLIKEMKVEEGTRADWVKLCRFHYRGHNFSVARKFFP